MKEHRVFSIVIACLLVVGFALGGLADSLQIIDLWPGEEASPHTEPPSHTPTPPLPTPAARAKGSCFTDENGPSISCADPHLVEEITDPCTVQGLVALMAGDAERDVTFDRPRQVDGRCLVTFDNEVKGSVLGLFDPADSTSSRWRRCLSTDKIRFVRCDQPHWGEYIAKPTKESCTVAASAYVQTPLTEMPGLTVAAIETLTTDADPARCVVGIRGDRPLIATVRRLGQQALPTQR